LRKAKRKARAQKRRLRVLFTDEARFGRINSPRPCWAPRKVRPEVAAQLVREYIYLYGAVCPKDGSSTFMVLPDADTVCFQIFLDALAKTYLREFIMLVLDGAPNHNSGDLKVPANIELVFLPPYSPELNPQENIWEEIREKIFKNYALKSMDEVNAKLDEAVLYLDRNPRIVKSISSFPYIINSL
jgi:transposase